MTSEHNLITRLEQYYDTVPRRRARTEQVGRFTLFVTDSGWPYYARPSLGGSQEISRSDVQRVLDRQRELDVPRSIEWVDEVTPGLAEVVESTGAQVARCPLLVLGSALHGSAGTARMLGADEVDTLVAARAAISVGFGHAGTATGDAGIEARDAALDAARVEVDEDFLTGLEENALRMAAVFAPESADEAKHGPVGGGSYTPVEQVAEITGVAVLPVYRRNGLAAQVTYALATDAAERGVTTVFCSAQSDDVARVYERIGFRRVATACIAAAS